MDGVEDADVGCGQERTAITGTVPGFIQGCREQALLFLCEHVHGRIVLGDEMLNIGDIFGCECKDGIVLHRRIRYWRGIFGGCAGLSHFVPPVLYKV